MSTCVVLACAGSKIPNPATFSQGGEGIKFVSDPTLVVPVNATYQHPDDSTGHASRTWRGEVVSLNAGGTLSPGIGLTGLDLTPAADLYQPPAFPTIYRDLHNWTLANGHDFAILSAGWGWVAPDFKLPKYDITFSNMADGTPKYRDGGQRALSRFSPGQFKDFTPWPAVGRAASEYVPVVAGSVDRIILLAGQSYVNLFCFLTRNCPATIAKEIFIYGKGHRVCPRAAKRAYAGGDNRTWPYHAAQDIIAGNIVL